MMQRIRKAMADKDQGFTLIELLVVMIIIGILAAIAIPVFLNQRAKARDTSTKADISTIGKEVATFFVEPVGTIDIAQAAAGDPVVITVGAAVNNVNVSDGTVVTAASFDVGDELTWCVTATNPAGQLQAYEYSVAGGLAPGTC